MNFKNYFIAVWQGIVGKSELIQANDAGQATGRALVQEWLVGVAQGASEELEASVPLLLGNSLEAREIIEEAEITSRQADFSDMTKSQLRAYARENEIQIDGRWSTDDIRQALTEYEG